MAILLDDSEHLGELEARRIRHCCELEVLKGHTRCMEMIRELTAD